jgi:flagellar FliJ protein
MSKFIFRLEPVLKQRKREEQERQRELASRELVVVNLQNDLKRLDESLQGAAEDLRKNHLTGAINLNFLTAHRRFLTAMQRQGIGIVLQVAGAQVLVDEARQQLAEAAKRRKVIEKLREKQFARWREDQERRELAQLDEIGAQIAYANITEGDA